MTEEAVAVAAVEETTEESKASFKSFEEMIDYFKEKIDNISKLTLSICWEIGHEVRLIKDAAVYGEKTVENFADSLDIPNMNVKRLYRYAQFANEYTRAELNSAMEKQHVGWGVINKLISVKDKEDRVDFEDKVANGDIKPSELDEQISIYMSEQDADEDGETVAGETSVRRSYIKFCKKGVNTLEILKNVLPLAIKDMDDLSEIADNEDKYNKALEEVYSLREAIAEVTPLLEEAAETATKLA